MEHTFIYLKKEADAICNGEPSSPKKLEAVMEQYDGACEEKQKEIVGFLSAFTRTSKMIAKLNYGIPVEY